MFDDVLECVSATVHARALSARVSQQQLETYLWGAAKLIVSWALAGTKGCLHSSHRSGRFAWLCASRMSRERSRGRKERIMAAFVWRSLTRRYLAIEGAGLKQRSERVAASGAATAAQAM